MLFNLVEGFFIIFFFQDFKKTQKYWVFSVFQEGRKIYFIKVLVFKSFYFVVGCGVQIEVIVIELRFEFVFFFNWISVFDFVFLNVICDWKKYFVVKIEW